MTKDYNAQANPLTTKLAHHFQQGIHPDTGNPTSAPSCILVVIIIVVVIGALIEFLGGPQVRSAQIAWSARRHVLW